jgi:DNA-binding transcriptional regulator GbsR (MarR family)
MANEVANVRAVLEEGNPVTLADIQEATGMPRSSISMALCYFIKRNQVSRELIENPQKGGRKNVWQYKYITLP